MGKAGSIPVRDCLEPVELRPHTLGKSLAAAILAVLLFGIVYERIGRWQDRKRLPQIGRSVDIGGRSLNIYCSGIGDPPVIFESGGAGPGLSWEPIQTEVAKFTEACWYDRAGEGWSDPGPFPRTSAAIANDLHQLLRQAGIRPPFVLAGASFGGLNSRVYTGLYPREVAGLVLIDSAHEDEPSRAPKFYLARTLPRYLWHPIHLLFEAAAATGLLRLTQRNRAQPGREELLRALSQQSKSFVGNTTTGLVMPESYREVRASGGLGDRPLIVLTAGKPPAFDNPDMAREAAAYQQVWIHEMQANLARLSTRGRQIVVENSEHDIQAQAADAVIAAIREVVTEVRQAKVRR